MCTALRLTLLNAANVNLSIGNLYIKRTEAAQVYMASIGMNLIPSYTKLRQ